MNFVVCKSFGKNFVNIKTGERKGARAHPPKFFWGRDTDKTPEEIEPKLYLIARLFSVVFAVQEFFSVPPLPLQKK